MTLAIIQTIETELEDEWTKVKTEAGEVISEGVEVVEVGAQWAWNIAKPVMTSMATAEWAQLKPIVEQAMNDVESGDINDIEQSVLEKAEVAGLTFVSGLKNGVITAIISAAKLLI